MEQTRVKWCAYIVHLPRFWPVGAWPTGPRQSCLCQCAGQWYRTRECPVCSPSSRVAGGRWCGSAVQQLCSPVAGDGDWTSGGRGKTRRGRHGATATADATAIARRGPHDGQLLLYTISRQYIILWWLWQCCPACDTAWAADIASAAAAAGPGRDRNNIMNALRRGSPAVLCGGRLTRAPVPLSRMPVVVPAGARPWRQSAMAWRCAAESATIIHGCGDCGGGQVIGVRLLG
jgi:hypothetical protein